jgi:hypothetical protein
MIQFNVRDPLCTCGCEIYDRKQAGGCRPSYRNVGFTECWLGEFTKKVIEKILLWWTFVESNHHFFTFLRYLQKKTRADFNPNSYRFLPYVFWVLKHIPFLQLIEFLYWAINSCARWRIFFFILLRIRSLFGYCNTPFPTGALSFLFTSSQSHHFLVFGCSMGDVLLIPL